MGKIRDWLTAWLRPCAHQWEKTGEFEMQAMPIFGYGEGVVIGRIFVLRCKHCGDMKQFRVEK